MTTVRETTALPAAAARGAQCASGAGDSVRIYFHKPRLSTTSTHTALDKLTTTRDPQDALPLRVYTHTELAALHEVRLVLLTIRVAWPERDHLLVSNPTLVERIAVRFVDRRDPTPSSAAHEVLRSCTQKTHAARAGADSVGPRNACCVRSWQRDRLHRRGPATPYQHTEAPLGLSTGGTVLALQFSTTTVVLGVVRERKLRRSAIATSNEWPPSTKT